MSDSNARRNELIEAKLTATKLANLKMLLDMGVISTEEFKEKAIKLIE